MKKTTKRTDDHKKAVARIKADISPGRPCALADAEGYCTQGGGGFICCKCDMYTPAEPQTSKPNPQHAATDAATAGQPEPINARLVYQYRRAESAKGQFVREATAFGVMLMEAEKDIRATVSTAVETVKNAKRGQKGKFSDGASIEHWLSENCPEIAYKTAQSYKALAQKMVEMMGGPQPAVLAALAAPSEMQITYETIDDEGPDQVPSEIIEERETIYADATSRRKLEQMYFNFARKSERADMVPGAGAPLPKVSRQEAARRIWAGLMAQLDKRTALDAIALLPPADAKVCHDRLFELTKAMKAQMAVGD